jgi:homoserine acetyltransferase
VFEYTFLADWFGCCARWRSRTIKQEIEGQFTTPLEQELADHLGNATLKLINSEEGHDGFLLEQSRIGPMIHQLLRTNADPA